MLELLLLALIVVPLIAAIGCLVAPAATRTPIVAGTAAILVASSLALFAIAPVNANIGHLLGIPLHTGIALMDFALLFVIFYFGYKRKSLLVQAGAAAQLVLLAIFELFMVGHADHPTIVADDLSLTLVLVISIVGSLICVFAIPYMKEHEEHLHITKSKQGKFFFFLVLFLGAMNALVLTNDLLWFYFFFEVTTFCSFMLIGHDANTESIQNSTRALWMNVLGGLFLMAGIMWAYAYTGTLGIQETIAMGHMDGALLLPFALICLGGFTKAAQFPFQSWLLGAMVAPTPTSALLHSSTMVKAGVYLVLRFSPAFAGTFLSDAIAVFGGFTFAAAAALAISQSNGKRILAYSTISNLGLIIVCAGINTPVALAAGIVLIIFHAVSKALLFMCVGTIEQSIGSRDIEDMRGLYSKAPVLAGITIVGLITMLLPPFGVLLGKWMAIEAASRNVLVIILLALGSAMTVLVYARWAGALVSGTGRKVTQLANMVTLTRGPLTLLAAGAVVLSVLAPAMLLRLVENIAALPFADGGGLSFDTPAGAFILWPIFAVLAAGALWAYKAAQSAKPHAGRTMYLSGVNLPDTDEAFKGPMDQPVKLSIHNYYMRAIFGENKLTGALNITAIVLLAVIILGGAL